jgi:hypothetical protein
MRNSRRDTDHCRDTYASLKRPIGSTSLVPRVHPHLGWPPKEVGYVEVGFGCVARCSLEER